MTVAGRNARPATSRVEQPSTARTRGRRSSARNAGATRIPSVTARTQREYAADGKQEGRRPQEPSEAEVRADARAVRRDARRRRAACARSATSRGPRSARSTSTTTTTTGAIRGLLCFTLQQRARRLHDDRTSCSSRAAEYLDRDDELAALARDRAQALVGLSSGVGSARRWLRADNALPHVLRRSRSGAVVRRSAPARSRRTSSPGPGSIGAGCAARGRARHHGGSRSATPTAW